MNILGEIRAPAGLDIDQYLELHKLVQINVVVALSHKFAIL